MLQPREAVTVCPECKKRDARIARLERELAEAKDAVVCASDRVEQLTAELNRVVDDMAPPRLGFVAAVESGKKEIREALKGSLPPFDTLPLNGLYCAECLEPQRTTIGGACCKNHHGGVDGLPSETPRVLGPLTIMKELIVRDDEAPEKIFELARSGKVPRGWFLAVGKGPCVVCEEPTSGRWAEMWKHYECKDHVFDPNAGTLGHNRPLETEAGKNLKTLYETGATLNLKTTPRQTATVEKSRTDDAAEF